MPAESAFVENSFIKKNRIEQRAYQVNLAESVLKGGNSLVVAPTALGKTIVAVLVAAAVLEREKGKKILFLAPTKPLCQQHQNTMQGLMQLEKEQIILLTGSIAVKKRAKQWEQALIVTATPQTIENDVRNARISLQNVSLIIFDEAHRAVGDYAYVYIAKKFTQQNQKALLLGLTASPGAEQEHINEVCGSLFIKNIEIKSLGDEDVKPYTHEIKIEWRTVELPIQFKEIKGMLQQFMQKQIAVLNKFGLSRAKSPAGFNQKRLLEMQEKIRQGIKRYGFRQPSLFSAATAIAALMKANHAAMLLETQGIAALNSFLERTVEKSNEPKASRALRQFLASTEIRQAMDLTKQLNEKGIRHPKQHVLEELLKQQFELFPESRVIVFNHYRDSIKRLAEELNKVPGIRAERFVGQATKGKDIGMSQKDQAEKIAMLRSGEINCIVASSVAEEGLDIPAVDLVIFYEPVPSEIRYIQRRGRTGRLAAGRAIILMAKGTRDEAFYWVSIKKEKRMHHILRRMKAEKAGAVAEKESLAFAENEIEEEKAGAAEEKSLAFAEEEKAEHAAEKKTKAQKHAAAAGKKEKQTTLHSFVDCPAQDSKIVVFADTREKDSPVIQLLQELNCQVLFKQLEVGDYIPAKDIAIERKTVSDFLSSIVDGRLPKQLMSLTESYERPIVLVEGDVNELFESRNIHRNAVIGMLTSIALNYRVPLLFTDSARETAQYIYVIAKREQLGKGADLRLRIGRKGLTLAEQQRFVVESLPLIGPMTAKNLLQHFGSIKAIFNAEEKELQQVDNLGKEKAKRVKRLLEANWGEK
jgi:Fanconi anemia group M protein